MPIFLLGMMGAGKSTVGRTIARERGAVFIDLDERIELLSGAAISSLFERGGEALFRARERAALRSLVDEPGFAHSAVVVATGGGIVGDPDNLRTMSEVGRLVYLEVDVETLCARLCAPAQRETRPMLGDEPNLAARLTELLAAREPSYRHATLIVDGRGSPDQVAARVLQQLPSAADGRGEF
jgi:shikimate kinase